MLLNLLRSNVITKADIRSYQIYFDQNIPKNLLPVISLIEFLPFRGRVICNSLLSSPGYGLCASNIFKPIERAITIIIMENAHVCHYRRNRCNVAMIFIERGECWHADSCFRLILYISTNKYILSINILFNIEKRNIL